MILMRRRKVALGLARFQSLRNSEEEISSFLKCLFDSYVNLFFVCSVVHDT